MSDYVCVRYNKRFGSDGMHEALEWDKVNPDVEAFKNDFIFREMVVGEKDEMSMFDWLKIVPMHSFLQRHFESDLSADSVLRKTFRMYNKESRNDDTETQEEEVSQEEDKLVQNDRNEAVSENK